MASTYKNMKISRPTRFFKYFVNSFIMSSRHNSNISNSRLKFTKGEKCIFTHLVLTFSLILIIVIIYLVHLYLVNHSTHSVFSTRRLAAAYDSVLLDAVPVGIIYLNMTPVLRSCNTLLLRRQWSLGPGHCITLMSQPDLSHLLYEWRLKYRNNEGVRIIKSVVHPHFDTDTFVNNVGVISHSDVTGLQEYSLFNTNYEKNHNDIDNVGQLLLISWLKGASLLEDNNNNIGIFPAHLLLKENCPIQMAPITVLRSYETCVVFDKAVDTSLGHGAVALQTTNLQVFGFFTWGEKLHRTFPLVILNLSHFQEWLDSAMTL